MYYSETVSLIPNRHGSSTETPLNFPIRIRIDPLLTRLMPYSEYPQKQESLFPKSTESWHPRMKHGTSQALYTVREVLSEPRFWLSVVDPITGRFLEKHFIHPYEIWPLVMKPVESYRRDWLESIGPDDSDIISFRFMRALEDEMTWPQICSIANDADVSSFRRSRYAWDTLQQLIPLSIQGEVRYELMSFFAWVAKGTYGIDDPVEFFQKLSALRYFKSLLEVHFRYIVGETDPPPYLSLLRKTVEDSSSERITSETNQDDIFTRFLDGIMERSPDWRSIAVRFIESMSQSEEVIVKFPVSLQEARTSKQSWMDRFILFSLGIHIRTHVRASPFGLRRVFYFGNAHRWPHPMLSWSADLGIVDGYPLQVQVALMPPSSLERVKRYLPKMTEIEWSARMFNPRLFNHFRTEWSVSVKKILGSLQGEQTFASLHREFGRWKGKPVHKLAPNEARVLDATVARLNLAHLENPNGREHLGVTPKHAGEILTRMQQKNAIQVFYEFNETRMPSPLFLTLNGLQERICNIARAILSNSPSAVAYIAKGREKAFIISSLPKSARDLLMRQLPSEGSECGLDIQCALPVSFQNYTCNLFQRLLRSDGTWVTDAWGLLTQASSLTKKERLVVLGTDYEEHLRDTEKVMDAARS